METRVRRSGGRWAPASGIVYAVLVVTGTLLIVLDEIDSQSNQAIAAYYADAGNRLTEIVGFFLMVVGVLFFLVFVSTLWNRFGPTGKGSTILSSLVVGAGVAAAALFVVAACLLSATSFAVTFESGFQVDPNLARFVTGLGYQLLLAATLVTTGLVVATSTFALTTSALPTWLGWIGFAAVVLAVIEMFLLAVFVLPLWAIVVSVVLMRQQVRSPSEDHRSAPAATP